MPNIVGEYSLSEVAHKVGVSTAWINKVQKVVGVLNKINQKGKRVSFSKEDIVIFRRINMLRTVNFSLPEIKEIHGIEKKMIDFAGADDRLISDKVPRYIIFPYAIAKEMEVPFGDPGDHYQQVLIDEQWYIDDAKRILDISHEVVRRLKGLKKNADDFMKHFEGNVRVSGLKF